MDLDSNSREFQVERKCETKMRIERDLDIEHGDKVSGCSEGSGESSALGARMFV
jgi:hypothetical protein